MGLQYLTDRPELRRDREKIFDEIQKGIIKKENIDFDKIAFESSKEALNFYFESI